MKEITIEIRSQSISIQAPGIQQNVEKAKAILQTALAALEEKPESVFHNELVFLKKA